MDSVVIVVIVRVGGLRVNGNGKTYNKKRVTEK